MNSVKFCSSKILTNQLITPYYLLENILIKTYYGKPVEEKEKVIGGAYRAKKKAPKKRSGDPKEYKKTLIAESAKREQEMKDYLESIKAIRAMDMDPREQWQLDDETRYHKIYSSLSMKSLKIEGAFYTNRKALTIQALNELPEPLRQEAKKVDLTTIPRDLTDGAAEMSHTPRDVNFPTHAQILQEFREKAMVEEYLKVIERRKDARRERLRKKRLEEEELLNQ